MTDTAAPTLHGIRRLVTPLAVLCIAQFMLQLDYAIVNVALKPIQTDVGFSDVGLQWVVTGYALTFGSLLLLGGRLGDRTGRRRLLLFGLLVFGAASAVCAVAQSPAMLVGGRLVQGVGAALVAPMVLAMLTGVYSQGAAQVRAIGIWAAATAGGAMSGVVLGGLMSDWFGWRSIFIVNIPIIAALVPLARAVLPEMRPEQVRSLDIPGTASITISLAALIFAMSSGEERGFGHPVTVGSLAIFAVLLAAFIAIELRAREPVVPFPFLVAPIRRTSVLAMLVVGAVTGSYIYTVSLALRKILDFSGTETSLKFIPGPVAMVFCSLFLSRRLIARFGMKPVLLLGLFILGAGQLWLAQLSADSAYASGVLPALFLTGGGAGLIVPTLTAAVTAGATPRERGLVGGLVPTAQQIGAAVGIAVLATIAASVSANQGGDLAAGYARSFLISVVLVALAAILVAFTSFRPPEPEPEQA
ncbi:unannotated protein [freshwater metagenome]|uniref:Unannotated protein n=1 Tax=freshwater metagenome TaxID=449393 RepID=A0A6J7J5S1_9ZZZZ|nr:MFS transporter [Actinomycetota bacterium]